MGSWFEQDFEAICVAHNEEVFQKIRAVICTDPSLASECHGDDPRVQKAFQAFNEVVSILIQEVSREDVNDTELAIDSNQLELGLRCYFHKESCFLASFPSLGPKMRYRVVKFSKGVVLPILRGRDPTTPRSRAILPRCSCCS